MTQRSHRLLALLVAAATSASGCSDGDTTNVPGASAGSSSGSGGGVTSGAGGDAPGTGGGGGTADPAGAGGGGGAGAPGALAGSVFGTSFELVSGTADSTDGTLYVTLATFQHACDFAEPKPDTYVFVNVTIPPMAQSLGAHSLGSGADDPRIAATVYGPEPGTQTSAIVTEGTLQISALDAGNVAGSIDVEVTDVTLGGAFDAMMCP